MFPLFISKLPDHANYSSLVCQVPQLVIITILYICIAALFGWKKYIYECYHICCHYTPWLLHTILHHLEVWVGGGQLLLME